MLHLVLVELAQVRLVARGFCFHAKHLQPAALLQQFGAAEIAAFFDLLPAPGDDLEFLASGRHLVEPGPANRIEPLAADGFVAIVQRASRASSPSKGSW